MTLPQLDTSTMLVGGGILVLLFLVTFLVVKLVKWKDNDNGGDSPASSFVVKPEKCQGLLTASCTSSKLLQYLSAETFASAPLPVCVGAFPGTEVCDNYTQYWLNFSSDSKTPRYASIAIPIRRTQPAEGWPVLVYFDLMIGDTGNGGLKQKWPTDPSEMQPWDVLQSALHRLVDLGIAVVCTSEASYDDYSYLPSSGLGYSYTCDASDPKNGCYNDGNNPDSEHFNRVFEFIRNPGSFDPSPLPQGVVFSYDRVGLMGYSVGAQMISSLLEHWPQLITSGNAQYPTLKGVVLTAGGSLYCYAYPSTLTSPYAQFEPCADLKDNGCCPSDITEPRFDSGSETPPPTLLVQQTEDVYADPLAATKYYQTRSSKHSESETCLLMQIGQGHGPAVCQQDAIVNFLAHYLQG